MFECLSNYVCSCECMYLFCVFMYVYVYVCMYIDMYVCMNMCI